MAIEHKTVRCLGCGKEIIQRNSKQMCCNHECHNEYLKRLRRERQGVKYCEVCGKELFGCRKYYCSDECENSIKLTPEKIKENFIKKFNKKFVGRFEYVSGYVNSESKILCKCVVCGNVLSRNAGCVRKGHTDIRCDNCANQDKIKRKSEKAQAKLKRKATKAALQKTAREQKLWSVCKECGEKFKGHRSGLKYCSDECRHKHNNRYREISRREKIKKNGGADYSISLKRLAKRDNYTCYICGEQVNMEANTNADSYGSIDHVVPISKGGTHTWDKVRLAHRQCNSIKSDSVTRTLTNGQVVMYI